MWQGSDADVTASMVETCQHHFPELLVCRFDRDSTNPHHRRGFAKPLGFSVLPRKNKRSETD